jgi:hypothetical protein
MFGWFELALGMLIWIGVLWDGFATVVLPRTVSPMRRMSGRFTRLSWWLWAAAARRIGRIDLRLSFLAVYGPLSVMFLLVLWGGLIVIAFALIYHGIGGQWQAANGTIDFHTLLYMSGSTFLTLGLGDVTSPDPIGRLFILFEAASGYIFLAMIITYMPLLDQAYGAREVGNQLIFSRVGRPPGAMQFLRRYTGADRSEILRSNLREAERWMAETLQSHSAHPVLSFYRAQHWGQSWLISLTTVLDSCALLIVGGEGLPTAQARLTYRMGLQLLQDLCAALSIKVNPKSRIRLAQADLPALIDASEAAGLKLKLDSSATTELLRLVSRHDLYLVELAAYLLIPLPAWIPPKDAALETRTEQWYE